MFFESRLRVRYKETDAMGIAHHGNYITWFEVGRTDLCRQLDWTYREIEASGFFLIVTELGCRYRLAYRYDDEVVIRTFVEEASRRHIRFRYELLDQSGLAHAEGFSAHLWVDRHTGKPVTAPSAVVESFQAARSKA